MSRDWKVYVEEFRKQYRIQMKKQKLINDRTRETAEFLGLLLRCAKEILFDRHTEYIDHH